MNVTMKISREKQTPSISVNCGFSEEPMGVVELDRAIRQLLIARRWLKKELDDRASTDTGAK